MAGRHRELSELLSGGIDQIEFLMIAMSDAVRVRVKQVLDTVKSCGGFGTWAFFKNLALVLKRFLFTRGIVDRAEKGDHAVFQ